MYSTLIEPFSILHIIDVVCTGPQRLFALEIADTIASKFDCEENIVQNIIKPYLPGH